MIKARARRSSLWLSKATSMHDLTNRDHLCMLSTGLAIVCSKTYKTDLIDQFGFRIVVQIEALIFYQIKSSIVEGPLLI